MQVNLYDQYLGDGYPLCEDLPDRAFMRAGARYRRSYQFEATYPAWFAVDNAPSIVLPSHSSLAHALCGLPAGAPLFGDNVNTSGCTLDEEVVLTDGLACEGDECLITNDAYVVQLVVGSPTTNLSVWYEFIRPACVELTFHPQMRRVRSPSLSQKYTCVDDAVLEAISDWDYWGAICDLDL